MILAALPTGAFICYGLLIAGKNAIDQRRAHAKARSAQTLPST